MYKVNVTALPGTNLLLSAAIAIAGVVLFSLTGYRISLTNVDVHNMCLEIFYATI